MSVTCMSPIPATEMPAPRLEFHWSRRGGTWENRLCVYSLVLPAQDNDRRVAQEGDTEIRYELERTHTAQQHPAGPFSNGGVDLPYRDDTHASRDSVALGLPVYVSMEGFDKAVRVLYG